MVQFKVHIKMEAQHLTRGRENMISYLLLAEIHASRLVIAEDPFPFGCSIEPAGPGSRRWHHKWCTTPSHSRRATAPGRGTHRRTGSTAWTGDQGSSYPYWPPVPRGSRQGCAPSGPSAATIGADGRSRLGGGGRPLGDRAGTPLD
jgi:hypothetical protein